MIDNVTDYAKQGVPAESLAQFFLKEYFAEKTIVFPINPFQMLTLDSVLLLPMNYAII